MNGRVDPVIHAEHSSDFLGLQLGVSGRAINQITNAQTSDAKPLRSMKRPESGLSPPECSVQRYAKPQCAHLTFSDNDN